MYDFISNTPNMGGAIDQIKWLVTKVYNDILEGEK